MTQLSTEAMLAKQVTGGELSAEQKKQLEYQRQVCTLVSASNTKDRNFVYCTTWTYFYFTKRFHFPHILNHNIADGYLNFITRAICVCFPFKIQVVNFLNWDSIFCHFHFSLMFSVSPAPSFLEMSLLSVKMLSKCLIWTQL